MSSDPAGRAAQEPIRVLLVDDTDLLRGLVRKAFNKTDRYTVVAEATDGGAGIDAAREHSPELIMLDLQMKPMSGFEALPVLHQLLPDAQIVIFTGHDEERHRSSLMADGAAATIGKGTPLRKVIEIVDDLFGVAS